MMRMAQSDRAILLDLDDTLYPERSYFESGLAAVAGWLADRDGEGPESAHGWRRRLLEDVRMHGRRGVLDRIPRPATEDARGWGAALLQVYRTHSPILHAFSDVDGFIARARLEGCRLGLVTDGKSCVQWRKLRALDLAERLDAIVCTDDLDTAKPDVTAFLAAAALLGLPPEACAYLSDDASKDFIGPKRLGMQTVQVRRDLDHPLARPAPDETAEADCRVASLTDAGELLFGARP